MLTTERRYATENAAKVIQSDELAEVRVRYKQPSGDVSKELRQVVAHSDVDANAGSNELRFAGAVAAFGQRLKNGNYLNDFGYTQIAALARNSVGDDPQGYRRDFVRLVETAQALASSTSSVDTMKSVIR